jgi:hypothetical protein
MGIEGVCVAVSSLHLSRASNNFTVAPGMAVRAQGRRCKSAATPSL